MKTEKLHANVWLIVLAFVSSAVCAAQGDVKGSRDHPLVGRYKGSVIFDYKAFQYDEYSLITGLKAGDRLPLEGKVTKILYRVPKGRATLEVMRNYEQALNANGFEKIFSCDKNTCGTEHAARVHFRTTVLGEKGLSFIGDFWKDQRFLSAKLARPEGDIYVSIYDFNDPDWDGHLVSVDVIELRAMEQDQIIVDANEMARQISESGRISLYGIYFDTDRADIKPESRPMLDEIARLMSAHPNLKLMIVGHTDNQGGIEYNLDLSTRRATSVWNELVSGYGISDSRLRSWGVGYLAPVATNKTEEGRAQNRRVELVEQ